MRRFQISDLTFGTIAVWVGTLEYLGVLILVNLMSWGVPPWLAGILVTLGHLVLGMCVSAWMSGNEPLLWSSGIHGDLLLRRDVHLRRRGNVMLMTLDRKMGRSE